MSFERKSRYRQKRYKGARFRCSKPILFLFAPNMEIVRTVRLTTALLIAASIVGCEIHPRTIREYRVGPGGARTISDVNEEQYWKERVDERIANELAGKKPEAPQETWSDYWRWWYGVLRRKSKPSWKSTEFKTSEDMVNYIKEKRRAKRLPTYDD